MHLYPLSPIINHFVLLLLILFVWTANLLARSGASLPIAVMIGTMVWVILIVKSHWGARSTIYIVTPSNCRERRQRVVHECQGTMCLLCVQELKSRRPEQQ